MNEGIIKNLTVHTSEDGIFHERTGDCYTGIIAGMNYGEISVTKNTNRNEKDTVIIAKYDVNGKLIGITYMKSLYEKKQEVTFGTLIENNGVSYIKAFVWDSLSGMAPLSNVCEF